MEGKRNREVTCSACLVHPSVVDLGPFVFLLFLHERRRACHSGARNTT